MADKKKRKSARDEAGVDIMRFMKGEPGATLPEGVPAYPSIDKELFAKYAAHLDPQGTTGTAAALPDFSGFTSRQGDIVTPPEPITTELPLKPVEEESSGMVDALMKRLKFLGSKESYAKAKRFREAEERQAASRQANVEKQRELEPLYKAIAAKEAARFLPGYAGPMSVPPVRPEDYEL
jgi:hypothetical protein